MFKKKWHFWPLYAGGYSWGYLTKGWATRVRFRRSTRPLNMPMLNKKLSLENWGFLMSVFTKPLITCLTLLTRCQRHPVIKFKLSLIQRADDTNPCLKVESQADLEVLVFINVNCCIQDFNEMDLLTNNSETNYIHSSLRNQETLSTPSFIVDDVFLNVTDSVKSLGIYLEKR